MTIDLNCFKHKIGQFCFLANNKEYLNFYGLECTESSLGGIIGYFGFFYTKKTLASGEFILGRNGTFEDMFERLQKRLCNKLNMEERSDSGKCIENLMHCIRKGPALIWINDYYLEYSPYYKKANYWSLVIVLKIDHTGIALFDNEVRYIDKLTFLKAVEDNGKYVFYHSENEKPKWPGSEFSAIVLGLNEAVSMMSETNRVEGEYHGIDGLKYFADELQNYENAEEIYSLFYQMNRASGPTVTRENMYRLCKELKEKLPLLEIDDCTNLYEYTAERWRKIGNLLFKLSTTTDDKLKSRIVERAQEVVELEVKGIYLIKNELIPQLKEHI